MRMHHPHGLRRRLLADHRGGPAGAAGVVAAGGPARGRASTCRPWSRPCGDLADGPLTRPAVARWREELLKGSGRRAPRGTACELWLDLRARAAVRDVGPALGATCTGWREDWLGRASRRPSTQAQELLIRRYLGGFGPASRKDLASWAGLPPAAFAPALDRMKLRRFEDADGGELLDLPRAPLPDPGTFAPVRFLPTWDAALLVHARRTQILPERFRPRIFNTKTPHSRPTFLVDGQVAGTWRVERGRIEIEPFERLSRETKRALDDEADRLVAFHG